VVAVSRDTGATWSAFTVDGTKALTAISCSAETVCVVAGKTGGAFAMVTTRDGGSTWSGAQSPQDAAISAIRCPDADDCLAVGEQVTPLKAHALASSDSGRTWTALTVPSSAGFEGYLAGARCLDATHCWVVGSGIWFTGDLGRSWQDLTPKEPPCEESICGPALHTLTDVVFTSRTDGWVVGGVVGGGQGVTQNPSYLGHTSNAGETFTHASDQVQDTYPYATAIDCQGSTCLVVGRTYTDSLLTMTTDSGRTWQLIQKLHGLANGFACAPGFSLCVVATDDAVLATH
jgi:photosystem II stability/assembly factor-like uncharacterized protein